MVGQGQQSSSPPSSQWRHKPDLPVAAVVAGSRRSAAWCSWPFSAVAADLCVLNVPRPGGLAVTLSWQLGVGSICPPAPCTAAFGTANETEMPMWLETGSPDGSLDLEESLASVSARVKSSGPAAR